MDDQMTDIWSIDADRSLQSVLDSPECPALLRRTLTGTLSWQARNETLVRQTIASPRIAPQWVAALLASGASVITDRLDGGGQIEVPLVIGGALLQPYALHVRLEGLCWGGAHIARTPADEPIVAAIAGVRLEDGIVQEVRVALTGVWPELVRLAEAPAQLVGGPLDEVRIQAVAEAVQEEVEPRGDFRGSVAYRQAMAGVLTRRALGACLHRGVEDE
jgi:carbon-monoxide dehydrogenase medium subunit